MTRREFENLLEVAYEDDVVELAMSYFPPMAPHPESTYLMGHPIQVIWDADARILAGGFWHYFGTSLTNPMEMPILFARYGLHELAALLTLANDRFEDAMPPFRGNKSQDEFEWELAQTGLTEADFVPHLTIYRQLSREIPGQLASYIRAFPHEFGPSD